MRNALVFTGRAIGWTGKVLFAGLILVGTFLMNCLGVLICAVSSD